MLTRAAHLWLPRLWTNASCSGLPQTGTVPKHNQAGLTVAGPCRACSGCHCLRGECRPNPCSSVETFAAHPSSQEADAIILQDPIVIGHLSSLTGCADSVSAPSVFGKAPAASFSMAMPSQVGLSGGTAMPLPGSDVSDLPSSSPTGVCNGSQPSTGTASLPLSDSFSPLKTPLSSAQAPQSWHVVQPTPASCNALLHALQSAPWPANSSTRHSVSMDRQEPSGYYNFGVQISNKGSLTAVTRLLPHLLQSVNAFLSAVWPAGTWNAVCWQEHRISCPSRFGQFPRVHELDIVIRRLHRGSTVGSGCLG